MKKQLLTIALLAGALTASAGVNLVVSGQESAYKKSLREE